MKHLRAVNKYLWKYRKRLFFGALFIIVSNYFGILAPQITGFVVDLVEARLRGSQQQVAGSTSVQAFQDPLVNYFMDAVTRAGLSFSGLVMLCGVLLLVVALLRGFFMFLMRQTIIVMSRLIEFDQKNEVYNHYQQLDLQFYKTQSTGDLMSRMAEDVSRVRMYTGPALMYLVNLVALIGFSLFYMLRKEPVLTLYVLSPLPILALVIYLVNTRINRKSEKIQEQLSDLTANAQESYSGIRVIKSFVQESAMLRFFDQNSAAYKNSSVNLAKLEALYFPSIGLLIGLSTLLTIYMGSLYQLQGRVSSGTIAEFVVYINMLTFPVSAIGWVASMIQRASASQKRLNEFLHTSPAIQSPQQGYISDTTGTIEFKQLSFTYPHTGIQALENFNLTIRPGEKIAIVGKTGSGKSTVGLMLLRMYDPDQGQILMNGHDLRSWDLKALRRQIAYVPQDVFLFSDTISRNICFGSENYNQEDAQRMARVTAVEQDILALPQGFDTVIGERGVTLSGGQKQRVSIARALFKNSGVILLDDCLSAVDAKTEKQIFSNLHDALENKTVIMVTHRIFSLFAFDRIIVIEDGAITEQGTHSELLSFNGYYRQLYDKQQEGENQLKPAPDQAF